MPTAPTAPPRFAARSTLQLSMIGLGLAGLPLAQSGCTMSANLEPDPFTTGTPAENNPAFHARIAELAQSYQSYARVDDEVHWAPFLCRQPMPSFPRRSMSTSTDTHGRKLYFVFAKDRAAYLARDGKTPAFDGQAVVKEAWTAEEVPASTPYDQTQSPVRYIKEGDKLYHAKDRAGLFVMYRVDPKTPGTDGGWVYGTVASDGATITSSGLVASCMGCHKDAKYERLFGMDYKGL